jgi:nitrate reductase gamma subunit
MYPNSPLLQFAENMLQIAALLTMATVYALKIRWILGFPAGGDRQAPGRNPITSAPRGAKYSLGAIAMPWTMASTRQHRILYAQFVVFHLGVAASILMSFLIPYAPDLMRAPGVVFAFQALFAAAAAAGVMRLGRRVADPYMRAISSPDDYFSLALLIVWLLASFAAAPNRAALPLLVYFFLTAFFLVYVPFSKISHYIYYPFARWYLGRTLGHRGVFPLVKGV